VAQQAGLLSHAAGHITPVADSTFGRRSDESQEPHPCRHRVTIVAAVLLVLSTTAASAATTSASAAGHVTAPQAPAAAGCVTEQFGTWDENTYELCVRDEQVLINDLVYSESSKNIDLGATGPLTVDGYYGPATGLSVGFFQEFWSLKVDEITGPQTWAKLCYLDWEWGFRGAYWHDAGCNTEPGLRRLRGKARAAT
jgi:Putative peptidoglycan binding domain